MILCAIGTTEIILITAVILLIFGGKKVPELMKGLGQGVRQFKKGMRDPSEDENNSESNIQTKEDIRQERLAMKRKQLEQDGILPIEKDLDSPGFDSANPSGKL